MDKQRGQGKHLVPKANGMLNFRFCFLDLGVGARLNFHIEVVAGGMV